MVIIIKQLRVFCLSTVLAVACTLAELQGFTFVQITDTHAPVSSTTLANVVKEINALPEKPSFVIDTGDFTETGLEHEYKFYKNAISKLKIPYYPLPGNHETAWVDIAKTRYIKYFGNLYKSFDADGIHFILLDSTIVGEHYGHFSKVLLEWLKTDLKKIGAETPVILFSHHPVTHKNTFVDNEHEIMNILEPYNVIAWFCGHGHNDTVWKTNGITFVMTKAVYAKMSYRIIDINTDGIRMYNKTLGKDKITDKTVIPLKRAHAPSVTIDAPYPGEWIHELPFYLKVVVDTTTFDMPLTAPLTLQYRINETEWKQLTPIDNAYYIIIVSTPDIDGEQLLELAVQRIPGERWVQWVDYGFKHVDRRLWTRCISDSIRTKPVVFQGKILFGSDDGNLYCLDENTGTDLWKFSTGTAVHSTPAVSSNTVIFGANDSNVYAVSVNDGKLVWKYKTQAAVTASPLIYNNNVYIGSGDNYMYCLDTKTGKKKWAYKTRGAIISKSIIEDNKIISGSWDGNLYAWEPLDGKLIWSIQLSKHIYYAPAIAAPVYEYKTNTMYIPIPNGTLYAINLSTGGITWATKLSGGWSTPVISSNTVINAGINGKIYSVSQTDGKTVWETSTGDTFYGSSPIILDGYIYICGRSGTLYKLDALTGTVIYSYHMNSGNIFSDITIADDMVFIPGMNGCLYILNYSQLW
ncbi:MAG: PQQ-binding-like beta-propeller repeat protein [Elusimicrobiota bacterium]